MEIAKHLAWAGFELVCLFLFLRAVALWAIIIGG